MPDPTGAGPSGRHPPATVFTWRPGAGFVPAAEGPAQPLRAADSWLVDNGMARGLAHHRARFTAACPADLSSSVEDFWTAMLDRLPRTGRWWPRVELTAARRLRLRIRPAPPPAGPVHLHLFTGDDPRAAPRRKGPDLHRLAGLRAAVIQRNGDEVLLTTRSGIVLETTTSSVLWWEGDDLCVPSPSLRLLPGVTARLIREIAGRLGVGVRQRRRRIADLDDREIWAVNALHGIRPVEGWWGVPGKPSPAIRAPAWQKALEECRTPVSSGPAGAP